MRLAAALLCLFVSAGLQAQELDELMQGFGTPTPVPGSATAPETPPTVASTEATDLTGSLVTSASYNYLDHSTTNGTQWHGLSKLRTRLNLQMDYRFSDDWQARVSGYGFYDWAYWIRDRDRFSNEVLDDYQHEADWQEVWLRGKVRSDLDLKLGRQVVNWGRADSLRVLDVLNPLDNREPGLTDIEDIRLPVTMLKADWFLSQHWRSSFIVIPEVRFSKNPPFGSDFAVVASPLFGGQAAVLDEEIPEHLADSQFAMSLAGTFSGWDISFHAAQLWRDTPYLHVAGPYSLAVPSSALQQLELRHSSMTMLGAGANLVSGSWLFKTELALFDDVDYTLSAPMFMSGVGMVNAPSANEEKQRADFLVGAEYFGIGNTALALEIANRHIVDYDSSMQLLYDKQDLMETALRYTGNFINDRLELTALAVAIGERAQDGALIRLQAAYDLQDALVLTVGVVDYCHGDLPPFDSIEKNDRVFAELKYSF